MFSGLSGINWAALGNASARSGAATPASTTPTAPTTTTAPATNWLGLPVTNTTPSVPTTTTPATSGLNAITPQVPQTPVVDNYGNVKLTSNKQALAQDYANKYLGNTPLTQDQWNYIAQNYTGSNLQNTVKKLAETQQINTSGLNAITPNVSSGTLAPTTTSGAIDFSNQPLVGPAAPVTQTTPSVVNQPISTSTAPTTPVATTTPGATTTPTNNQYDLSGFTKFTPEKQALAQQWAVKNLGHELTPAEMYALGQDYKGNNLYNTIKLNEEERVINEMYQNVLGRAPTAEEIKTATSKYNYKNIDDKLGDAIKAGATGADLLTIAKSELGAGADATDYVNRYLQGDTGDTLINEYEALKKAGIDTSLAGPGYFDENKLKTAYTDFTTKSLADVLGSANVSEDLQAHVLQSLVDGTMDSAQALDYIQNSPTNLKQEASRATNAAVQLLGVTQQQARDVYRALQSGATSAPSVDQNTFNTIKSWYDSGITTEGSIDSQALSYAASQPGAENSAYFTAHPELYYAYRPLEGIETTYEKTNPIYKKAISGKYTDEQIAQMATEQGVPLDQVKNKTYSVTGVNPNSSYGSFKGSAVLDASVIDDILGGDTVKNGIRGKTSATSGTDLLKGASSTIRTGAGVVGLQKVPQTDEMGNPAGVTITGNIKKAAEQAGIDTSKFKDTYKTVENVDPETGMTYTTQVLDKSKDELIFEAINDKYKGIYVIGSINDENQKNHAKDNFTSTTYKEVNGKLIPLSEGTNYTGYITPPDNDGIFGGGFIGDFAQTVASVPFIAEMAYVASGGNPAVYAAVRGAQAAAFSDSFSDVGKAAGTAYISASIMPQPGDVGNAILPAEFAAANPMITNAVGGAAINAAMSGAMAALSGQDVGNAILTGAATGALSATSNQLGATVLGDSAEYISSATGMPVNQVNNLVGNAINNALLTTIKTGDTGNFAQNVMNGLIASGVSTLTASSIASNLENAGLSQNAVRNIANTAANVVGTVTNTALTGGNTSQVLSNTLQNLPGQYMIGAGKGMAQEAANAAKEQIKSKEGGLVHMKTGGKVKGGLPHFEDGGYASLDFSYPSYDFGGSSPDFGLDTSSWDFSLPSFEMPSFDYGFDPSSVSLDVPSFDYTSPTFDFDTSWLDTPSIDISGVGSTFDTVTPNLTSAEDYLSNLDTGVNVWDQPADVTTGLPQTQAEGFGNATGGEFIADDVFSMKDRGLSDEAVRQNLGSYASTDAINEALAQYNSGATQEEGAGALDILDKSSGLELQTYNDPQFMVMDARALWDNYHDVAATQQNLIASGVDPLMAADIANMVAMGATDSEIYETLKSYYGKDAVYGQAFKPSDRTFWSGAGAGVYGPNGQVIIKPGTDTKTTTTTTTNNASRQQQQQKGAAGRTGQMVNLTGDVTKANTAYELSGLPQYRHTVNPIYKAEGGLIDHNPEFYSEGGSMANRYVKGRGDGTSDEVPAMLATGEFVIPADVVSGLGNGDNDSGAKVLDEFLSVIRKHKRAADSKELPPDSKGALIYLSEAQRKVK